MTEDTNNDSRLLEPDEVAELLAISRKRVYALARGGGLPHIRIGRYLRFRAEAVQRWIEESEVGGRR
jgi:excisionase family DNA binding protein